MLSLAAAFGCVEPERQARTVFTRKRPDVLTVTCNASGFEYQLHCRDGNWVGQQHNCSDIGKQRATAFDDVFRVDRNPTSRLAVIRWSALIHICHPDFCEPDQSEKILLPFSLPQEKENPYFKVGQTGLAKSFLTWRSNQPTVPGTCVPSAASLRVMQTGNNNNNDDDDDDDDDEKLPIQRHLSTTF